MRDYPSGLLGSIVGNTTYHVGRHVCILGKTKNQDFEWYRVFLKPSRSFRRSKTNNFETVWIANVDNTTLSDFDVENVPFIDTRTVTIPQYPIIHTAELSDLDGDGYPTYIEQLWHTDPNRTTTFEELTIRQGTIYSVIRISQPFDLDEMNLPFGAFYQVIRPVRYEDNGTPSKSDDHVTIECVLFPEIRYPPRDITRKVDILPIPRNFYPRKIQSYLDSGEITQYAPGMQKEVLDVLYGEPSSGYYWPVETNVEAVERIIDWINRSFERNLEEWDLPYKDILQITVREMYSRKKRRASTTDAELLVAALRAAGFPAVMTQGVFTNDGPIDGIPKDERLISHPQVLVYLAGEDDIGHWVRADTVRGLNYSSSIHKVSSNDQDYGWLLITDVFRDPEEADFAPWKQKYSGRPFCLNLHDVLEYRVNKP